MKTDYFLWLLEWFKNQCDGDWEHSNGIEIGTLDNPGITSLNELLTTSFTSATASITPNWGTSSPPIPKDMPRTPISINIPTITPSSTPTTTASPS